jgi:hypothetical protein
MSYLISNPRDNHGFGQIKESQFSHSMSYLNLSLNISLVFAHSLPQTHNIKSAYIPHVRP